MSFAPDLVRLRATLGAPALARVLETLRKRIEQGKPLTGRLTLENATPIERENVDALLGRKSSRGNSLALELELLEKTFREAGVCENLLKGVESLCGPVPNKRAAADAHDAEWVQLWSNARHAMQGVSSMLPWLADLEATGLLKRLCAGQVAEAEGLLRDMTRLAGALPVKGEPLPAFAARLFGDSHALDPGTPRSTLAVRAAAKIGAISFEDDAEGRRAAWASVGVMSDELSAPVLVFMLSLHDASPLGRLLRTATEAAEPHHLSARLLLKYPISNDASLAGRPIFICENPTVVAMAADRLGRRCAPLLCVNGQFATPSLILLRQLRKAGAILHYHGDFDPGGMHIARRVFTEADAKPWRYSANDYHLAPKGILFTGDPGPTPWSPELAAAMRADGHLVHEESVFESLACDLEVE